MNEQLPARRNGRDLSRFDPENPLGGDLEPLGRPVATPAAPPDGRADIVASALNVGEIKATNVHITVNHYHAQVTQQVRTEVVRVEQTHVEARSERIDYRPTYAPTPPMTFHAPPPPRGLGFYDLLGGLGLAFFGLTAFVILLVVTYRWLMTPVPVPTTVVVPVAGRPEPPAPRSFLDSLETRDR